ncbi:o-succinylbenzoate synthase [Cytophagaceae bacterium ABcell3]|nr:o-succinylbenzoate synthase [Cytophagaceae bacterium ABcell3]
MKLRASYQKYNLKFKFDAGTSRGVLKDKNTWFVKLYHPENPEVFGFGEAGPLKGLSVDDRPDFETQLSTICQLINEGQPLPSINFNEFPSIAFALETALADLENGGKKTIVDTSFSQGKEGIPINGLIWMGAEEFMAEQLKDKLAQGYACIKIKIGAIDFEAECRLLQFIRSQYSAREMEIRVDANGAFDPDDALKKLDRLAVYDLHSIEQPIKQGQFEKMHEVCKHSPVPVALDEELIGMAGREEEVLDRIRPQFIILKPTLLGGMQASETWISCAEKFGIGWWITSALESNIGLNAIAQFTSQFNVEMPQGLGTGQLYHNNIPSPLVIQTGKLLYKANHMWDVGFLKKGWCCDEVHVDNRSEQRDR